MFNPKTEKIAQIQQQHQDEINQLIGLLQGNVHVYIDYANVKPWSQRLGWHVDLKRLKQFIDSFDNIKKTKFYYGILKGDEDSKERIEEARRLGYDVRTKPVKIMKLSIDASSINIQSTDLLKNFIRGGLLREYKIETIEYLNNKFKEMNRGGIFYIKDQKCNFDVEIGSDMMIDKERNSDVNTFILWSGDSDFHDPISELLDNGRKVILFATPRVVASELNELVSKGLFIFDIKKIKEFICWKRELGS